jgi:hypothetical protein
VLIYHQDLFSFRATDVLNYDLADVRLPGAVPDPLRPGQTRLAAPIPSNTISTRNAKLPGAPSSSASAAAAATKKKTIDLNGPAIPALSAQALSSTAPASPDHASPSAHGVLLLAAYVVAQSLPLMNQSCIESLCFPLSLVAQRTSLAPRH